MVNLHMYPDVLTFNIVIDGLCKEGKVEDAEEVMKHMAGKGVEPDIITYNTIMDGYCLCGQRDRARRVFDSMIDKNIESDIISYNILINGYCKEKKVDESMQLFCEISHKGSKPNTATYNTILQGLFEVGRIGDVKQIYAEMISWGPYLIHTLMPLCSMVILSTDLLKKLCHSLISWKEREKILTIINGFCLEGLLDEANDMLRKMEENGYLPNDLTYNDIVRGFLRCNKISEMAIFMMEMAGRGFSFDARTSEFLVDVIREKPSVLDMIPELYSEYKK
ncbi:hypothetical protein RND71_040607 [Anisodus tanguticus]|uniref:Pentatricopeptide repeat-containing protein n=1 Tax=Anisodus tanguticus TaxID=243964 RepID=A0AAE1UVV9_9SOLA|nr:hypothetical protein RND71_040607 [Anisodus tanguticus]